MEAHLRLYRVIMFGPSALSRSEREAAAALLGDDLTASKSKLSLVQVAACILAAQARRETTMSQVRIEDEILVNVPAGEVWRAIKEPARHADWHPFVTRISGEHRLGATRSCSVIVGKKTGETKERCVEDDEERTITWAIEEDSTGFGRMVSDWQSGFALERRDGATLVRAQSAFRPKNVLVRIVSPIVTRKFRQAQQAILAGLKQSIETGAAT
jgi:uncharacterized protein YndB with AHSA1/START domain